MKREISLPLVMRILDALRPGPLTAYDLAEALDESLWEVMRDLRGLWSRERVEPIGRSGLWRRSDWDACEVPR